MTRRRNRCVETRVAAAGLVIAAAAGAAPAASGGLRLPALFSDHAVLQRDLPLPVWGWAAPGATVRVAVAGQTARGIADAAGRWQVRLDPLPLAPRPTLLSVDAGSESLAVHDVVVGDVWLCAGQSNMKRPYGRYSTPEERQTDDLPLVRHFEVVVRGALAPADEGAGAWRVCTPATVRSFTGTGYFFGRQVHRATGVPIGLLNASQGSTRIAAWLAPDQVDAVPELAPLRPGLDAAFAAFRAQQERYPPADALAASRVTPPAYALYFGMIHPLIPYGLKGALWYQGESDAGDGALYWHKLRALVGGWRAAWGQGDVSFYVVQLPAFRPPSDDPSQGDGWGAFRLAQARVLTLPRTGLAVTIDAGLTNNVHPDNIRTIGGRLALWALRHDYGRSNTACLGPLVREMTVSNGTAWIAFDHAEGGLVIGRARDAGETAPVVELKDAVLPGVAVAGADGRWVWADAVPDGPALRVSSPAVPRPAVVRYAWNASQPGRLYLYNRAGLPAAPFVAEFPPQPAVGAAAKQP